MKDESSSSKGCMSLLVLADDTSGRVLDPLFVVLYSTGSTCSVLMVTICWPDVCFFSFPRPTCGFWFFTCSSSWTRCLLLEDEAATVFKLSFCSVDLSVSSCACWPWFPDGCSSRKSISSDIRASSSSICISASISFLFLLHGSSWTAWETLFGWASDRPTKRSAVDPSGVWHIATGALSEHEDASLDLAEVFGVCLASVSRAGRLGSDMKEKGSSSKGLDEEDKEKNEITLSS